MRGPRRWLLRAVAALFGLAIIAALILAYRYHLDLWTGFKRALRNNTRFTVALESLQVARYARVLWLGDVPGARIDELSGLVVSRRSRDLLWAINDSGDGPFLYALGEDGRPRGELLVQNAINVDWEDLAAFDLDGTPYLLIADIGDNFAIRPAVTLYLVEEPRLDGERFAAGTKLEARWILRMRYEGGPEDCEAVAVDAQRRRVFFLSKHAVPPVLYGLDLVRRRDDPRALDGLLVARRLTTVNGIPQPTAEDLAVDPGYGPYSSRPTAMDIAADGSRAVVFNYKYAFLFDRRAGESWARAFARAPVRVPLPRLRALESGAFALDGHTLYISSEHAPAPIIRLDP